jgi:hypothetical protein
MEVSQGSSLYSYLKQTKMLFYFSFTKSQEGITGSVCGASWYQKEGRCCGENVWEGEYGTNTVYTCM